MPTEEQAEGLVEGLLRESIEGLAGERAEVQVQQRASASASSN